MRVLVTGAFGNVGTSALGELLRQGHQVRCFDIKTKANERMARRWRGQVEVVWGDLRRPEDVLAAVQGQDVVVHLAFIIPKLSATGVGSEDRPDWSRAINVGGTRHLLAAIKAQPRPPRLIFASSLHVYGHTQNLPPPRTVDDPVCATEHYSQHKIECEQMVRESGLTWAILRFGAAMPVRMVLDPGMFDVPLDNRIEFVHTRDVGLALANAVSSTEVWGRLWLIGGGPECQLYYRDLMAQVTRALGLGTAAFPEEAFAQKPFATDWLDTRESQRVLQYQRHTLQDYLRDLRRALGWRLDFIRMFRPWVRRWLLRQSPHLSRSR